MWKISSPLHAGLNRSSDLKWLSTYAAQNIHTFSKMLAHSDIWSTILPAISPFSISS